MNVEVLFRPTDLRPEHCAGRSVVVFDVLRATTTMTAALAAGVSEIQIFSTVAEARAARAAGEGLLCGEEKCLPPPGFDLGNSPGTFVPENHQGCRLLMATTNGTRAIVAARPAERLLIGALVNARAVARRLQAIGLGVTLLCAGTNGQIAMEDLLGAGAVLAELGDEGRDDPGRIARRLFDAAISSSGGLVAALRDSAGGRNVIAAGLEKDIDFAARLNRFEVVGEVRPAPLRVVSDVTACTSADPPAQTIPPGDSTPA